MPLFPYPTGALPRLTLTTGVAVVRDVQFGVSRPAAILAALCFAVFLPWGADSLHAQSVEDRVRLIETSDEAFKAQWGLKAINAHWAYARGATGDGVTIGLIDDGIHHLHPAFAGKLDSKSILFYLNDQGDDGTSNAVQNPDFPAVTGDQPGYTLPGGRYPHPDDVCSGVGPFEKCQTLTAPGPDGSFNFWRVPFVHEVDHGTWTSNTAAGTRQAGGAAPHGVGYGARIRFTAIDLPGTVTEQVDDTLRNYINDGVQVINLSFGSPILVTDPRVSAGALRFGQRRSRAIISAQLSRTSAERTLLVWAAGNLNNKSDPCFRLSGPLPFNCESGRLNAESPDISAGAPYHLPELRGHSLAVAATMRDNPDTGVNEGEIAEFSNRCGALPESGWVPERDGRHYCLSAPGVDILVPEPDCPPGEACPHTRVDGTSFAAPHVSGAAAVLMDFYTDPNDGSRAVGNTAVAQRMLDTANRRGIYAGADEDDCVGTLTGTGDSRECSGDYAYTKTYGAGLLDLKAATEPVGIAGVAMGRSLAGYQRPLAETFLSPGAAYGDAFRRAFAGIHIASFDSALFPFWQPLATLTPTASLTTLHERRARFAPLPAAQHLPGIGQVRLGVVSTGESEWRPTSASLYRRAGEGAVFVAWRAPDSTPLSLTESLPTPLSGEAFAHPFLSFAGEGMVTGIRADDVTVAAFVDTDRRTPTHGVALDRAFAPFVSVQAGMLHEKGGVLGLSSEGAFGDLDDTVTAFTGLKIDAPVSPRWRVLAHAHLGAARPGSDGAGLVKDVSSLTASAFSTGIAGRDVFSDGDGFVIALSQPLRVESGRALLIVPTGRTPQGDLRRANVDVPLEPSGREITLSAAWTGPLDGDALLRLAAGYARHPDHNSAVSRDVHALADLIFRF